MIITLNGKPWPQMRARHSRNGHTYKAPAQAQAEARDVAAMIDQAKGQEKQIVGPLNMQVIFIFKRPLTHFGTGRNALIRKEAAPEYHVQKPDLDNLVKHVKDCGTKAGLWHDDCQVVFVMATKKWGRGAHTVIEIEEVKRPGQ